MSTRSFHFRDAVSEVWETFLLRLLGRHFERKFRRVWGRRDSLPHFFDHRKTLYDLAYGEEPRPLYLIARAFFTAELLLPTDRLLDIGCGDGFLTTRFYSPICTALDAIDIEPEAIVAAQRKHARPNVRFIRQDAVTEPFPNPPYDVIVWDGALGHFAAATTTLMMEKISAALAPDGVFVGSESLGREGHDHLQFFDNAADLSRTLQPHFRFVRTRTLAYTVTGDIARREIYWRCSQDPARLAAATWTDHASISAEEALQTNYGN